MHAKKSWTTPAVRQFDLAAIEELTGAPVPPERAPFDACVAPPPTGADPAAVAA